MRKATKIVFAGGPYSGKTSVFSHLKAADGTLLLKLPEAATFFFTDRTDSIWELDRDPVLRQFYIYRTQKYAEEVAVRFLTAVEMPGLVLCDRGVFDMSVYLRPEQVRAIVPGFEPELHQPDAYDLAVIFRGCGENAEEPSATVRLEHDRTEIDELCSRTETVWSSSRFARQCVFVEWEPRLIDKCRRTATAINQYMRGTYVAVTGFDERN